MRKQLQKQSPRLLVLAALVIALTCQLAPARVAVAELAPSHSAAVVREHQAASAVNPGPAHATPDPNQTAVQAGDRNPEYATPNLTSALNINPASASDLALAMGVSAGDLVGASLGSSDPLGVGVSDGALSYFPIGGGPFAILTTGLAQNASQANDSSSLSYQQAGLNNSQGNDMMQLTLQLRVPANITCMRVDFAYFSEEFPEFVGSQYNDAFTAEFGASSLSIIGSQVTSSRNFAYDQAGQVISVNTVSGVTGNTGTTYDGVTQLLRARHAVTPGELVTLVLTVQDLGDSVYDSAAFIDNFQWGTGPNCDTGSVVATKPPILLVHGIMLFDFSGDGDRCHAIPLGPFDPSQQEGGSSWTNDYGNAHNYFGPFVRWLAEAGYPVYQAQITTSPWDTPSLQRNAACLRQQVDHIFAASPNSGQRMVLVAHSMGGLVSRAYLSSQANSQQKVQSLYTFGSPHAGINGVFLAQILLRTHPALQGGWGVFCTLHPGVCQFGSDQMTLFNAVYANSPQIDYTFAAGDSSDANLPVGSTGWLLNHGLSPLDGPNDGAIGKHSAIGHLYFPFCNLTTCPDWVRGEAAKYWTHETHGRDSIGSPSYFDQTDQSQQTQSFRCLLSWLNNEDQCQSLRANVTAVNLSSTSDDEQPVSFTPTLTGTVNAGQTVMRTVQIDTTEQGIFSLTWVQDTLEFSLVRPGGPTLDPAYALAHPAEVGFSAAPASPEGLASATYVVTNVVPGTWTLNIHNPSGSPVNYSALTSLVSNRSLEVVVAPYVNAPGQTVNITAHITGTTGGVSGLSVLAAVARPDGVIDQVPLAGNGPGDYASSYVVPNAPGEALVSVVASGLDNGVSFAYQADKVLAISPALNLLSGPYTGAGVDADGNGLYDYLEVNLGLSAPYAGDFAVSGDLQAGGQLVSTASLHTALVAGSNAVSLRFDGNSLRSAQLDGPYTLTNVRVVDTQYGSIPAQTAASLWTSAAYSWQSFGTCHSVVVQTNPLGFATSSIVPAPNCNGGTQYAYGTQVQVTVSPQLGYYFANWIVDLNGTANPVNVTIDRDLLLVANLAAAQHFLPFVANGGGSSTGFNSQFNGAATGWTTHSGSWTTDSAYYRTDGLLNAWSTASYGVNFASFEYEARVWRYGCSFCANQLIVRGAPTSFASNYGWNNYYIFQYSRDGRYSVWKSVNGVPTPLQSWVSSSAVQTNNAWNILRVIANGSSFYYYINGVLVWTGSDASFAAGRVGLGMFRDATSTGNTFYVDWATLAPLGSSAAMQVLDNVGPEQAVLNQAATTAPAGTLEAAPHD
jgi:hypothetical protein